MKSISNKILILNIALMILTYLSAYFWTQIGLTDNENIYLGLIGIVIFGLSVGGFFAGIAEGKRKGKITRIGIGGNLILILLFLAAFGYVISGMV